MSDLVFHVGATALCPHAGQVSVSSSNARVKVSGKAVATLNDMTSVSGCPFQVPAGPTTKPQPCIRVQWTQPATRVRVGGSRRS